MKKARILIVEDEELVALGIRLFLQGVGFEVLPLLSSGEETVERFEELSPDLVLMDIRLEGAMTGIEAAGILRERYRVPVVFLTAYSDSDTMRGARLTSSYGYILKPFDEQTLAAMIAVALRKAELLKELHAVDGTEARRAARDSGNGANDRSGSARRAQGWGPASDLVEIDAFRMGGFLLPSALGAGDRFGFFRIDDSHLGLFTADILDYGSSAASRSAFLEGLFDVRGDKLLVREADPLVPRVVVEKLNDRLCAAGDKTGAKAFVALSYGVIDRTTRNLRLVVAGYPPPILQRRGGSIQEIPFQGFAAGVTPQFRVFEQDVTLEPADRLFFFSDGLADCADARSARSAEGRLLGVLGDCRSLDLMESIRCIQRDVQSWQQNGGPEDDVSLMVIQAG